MNDPDKILYFRKRRRYGLPMEDSDATAQDTTGNQISNTLGLTQSIVLVGLMGAGKSTIGRRLANAVGLPFRDSDVEIVEAAGCSIADIFEIHGEEIFRDLERRVIGRLISEPPCVLATGGGAFMHETLRNAIREKSISIWLKADLDVLIERVTRRNTRPLLEKGDKRAILSRLMEERYPIYANAHLTIDSDNSSHEAVVTRIVEALTGYGAA